MLKKVEKHLHFPFFLVSFAFYNLNINAMAIIDSVSWSPNDASKTVFAYKYPQTNLSTYTQLVVQESQEAILFSKGQLLQKFGPGKYTLSTENIPILRSLYGIPFGGKNPFMAEVWFVNKVQPTNIDWCTDSMSIHDIDYQTQIPLVARGRYGLRVMDAEKFLIKLVGTRCEFTEHDLTDQAYGEFVSKAKSLILQFMISQRIGFKYVSAHLDQLSQYLRESVRSYWEGFGIELIQLYITSIDVDNSTETGRRVAEAISRQSAQSITGHTWQQEQMFDVAQEAIGGMSNSSGNGMLGGIMALGMLGGMGGGLSAGMMNPQYNQPTFGGQQQGGSFNGEAGPATRMVFCSNCAKKYPNTSKFCPHCGDAYNPCPNCGADNDPSVRRCVSCGAQLMQAANSCPNCSAQLQPGASFCGVCGSPTLTADYMCSRCGAQMSPNIKFCPKCGKKRD